MALVCEMNCRYHLHHSQYNTYMHIESIRFVPWQRQWPKNLMKFIPFHVFRISHVHFNMYFISREKKSHTHTHCHSMCVAIWVSIFYLLSHMGIPYTHGYDSDHKLISTNIRINEFYVLRTSEYFCRYN